MQSTEYLSLCWGSVYYAVQGGSSLGSVDEILSLSYFNFFTFRWYCLLYKVFLTFESVDEILKCDHSNESY